MKKVFVFGVMVISILSFTSQPVNARLPVANPILFSSHGFNSIYLDPSGYNPVFSSFSGNPATSNPAGFSSDEKIHIWGKWAKNSEIKDAWFGFGYRQLKPEVPSGLGVSIPVYGLTLTAGFSRSLNYSLFSEDIPVTTATDPNGTGETYDVYLDSRLDNYSFSVSGNLALPGSEEKNLAFGMTIKYGIVKVRQELIKKVLEADDDAISFAFGAIYSLTPEFAEKVRIGLFAETKESYSGGMEIPEFYNDPIVSGTSEFQSYLPTRIHAGTEITYQSGMKAFLQGSLLMNEISGFLSKNQVELAGSVLYPVTESVAVSGGLLWDSWLKNEDSDFLKNSNDFKSVFLTTGVHAGFNGFLFDLALADNHFLSGKYRKQTILTAGIGYEF